MTTKKNLCRFATHILKVQPNHILDFDECASVVIKYAIYNISPLSHRHPLFFLRLQLIALPGAGRLALVHHGLLLECDTRRTDTDPAHSPAAPSSGSYFHDHHAPAPSYGPLEVVLVIVEPQVQQNMMLFLLEVYGVREVPRDEAVIDVSEHVYDT